MKNINILIVEDEVNINEIIKSYLEKENYIIHQSFNGKNAIESFDKYKPDIIILDIMLPDILGTEVTYSHVIKNAVLLPSDHEDLEMTIGQDYTIGYQSSDNQTIRFYATESFTYRTLDKAIIIKYIV